jgi:glycosyltransferase involved in cell wall biosynthesis
VNHALVGTESAGEVWRAKGYRGAMTVIPQFGVDPDLFTPPPSPYLPHPQPLSKVERGEEQRPFTIGYFGRLVEEKGIHLILQAALKLGRGSWRLCIVGSGPLKAKIEDIIAQSGVGDHVYMQAWLPSTEMPAQYRQLDVLVLPSLTKPNWKEQFGRVLVEAMASGVPVIGSDSGAIPDVIGDAGLIFPEGDVEALAAHLRDLQSKPELSVMLREKGRARVLNQFTHQQVATATVEVYKSMMSSRN